MNAIAILYDSSEGQTAKIAQFMAHAISESGCGTHVANIRELGATFQLDEYDGVILGGSVHTGLHSQQLRQFVMDHLDQLALMPSFFFSVSLSAAGKTERQQLDAMGCLQRFLMQTHWEPRITATLAGALKYRDYNFVLRWIMRQIAKHEGGDTDTSRNYEYTEWQAVRDFALKCKDAVEASDNAEDSVKPKEQGVRGE